MSIYMDTSAFLQIVEIQPHTAAILSSIQRETRVVLSKLTQLEALTHFAGQLAGGTIRRAELPRLKGLMLELMQSAPFQLAPASPRLLEAAIDQVNATSVHCRSLDRIHLTIMAELGISRLMTYDRQQAAAAKELGFSVLSP
jgi:predicted nucleic acid-binding protein